MYCKTFEELNKGEPYALAKLRQQVFIVEKNGIYTDLDDYDQTVTHYFNFNQLGKLTAYARYRQNESSNQVKIERVVLVQSLRGRGRANI